METESFSPPAVSIGDAVYWYNDPLTCKEPSLGWVLQRPGVCTLTLLVFTPNIGFQEKYSVRHRDDPGLLENSEWRQWGCWEYSPHTAQTKKMESLVGLVASLSEQVSLLRKQSGTKNG